MINKRIIPSSPLSHGIISPYKSCSCLSFIHSCILLIYILVYYVSRHLILSTCRLTSLSHIYTIEFYFIGVKTRDVTRPEPISFAILTTCFFSIQSSSTPKVLQNFPSIVTPAPMCTPLLLPPWPYQFPPFFLLSLLTLFSNMIILKTHAPNNYGM
jgi:hypothetical protein